MYIHTSEVNVFDTSLGNTSSIAYSKILIPIATDRGSEAADLTATREVITNTATQLLGLRHSAFLAILFDQKLKSKFTPYYIIYYSDNVFACRVVGNCVGELPLNT